MVLIAGPALGQSVVNLPPMTAITFAAGSATSTLAGQIVPGGRNVYFVLAKAGQNLSVSVASPNPGVTFQVYPPEATLAKGTDGVAVVAGRALPDAGPSDNKAWIGALPRDGNYLNSGDCQRRYGRSALPLQPDRGPAVEPTTICRLDAIKLW